MPDTIRAAVIIQKDNRFLLVQEGTPKVYGLWNWQQGRVEEGEDIEQAAIREAKEETGFDVAIERKVTVIEHPFSGTSALHIFLATITGGELTISEGEILEAKWMTRSEIDALKDDMVGPWVIPTIASI